MIGHAVYVTDVLIDFALGGLYYMTLKLKAILLQGPPISCGGLSNTFIVWANPLCKSIGYPGSSCR